VSDISNHSTTDLSEGTNLYYTDARVDARIAAASTTDLSEGTNLYYTDARADARIAAASITDLSDADQTVRTTDTPTFAGVTTTGTADVSSLTIGNFELVDNGSGELYIKYLGNIVALFNGFNGAIVVGGDVVAYGNI
jgi:hypothetical protein